jgi:hypothetical protein
MSIITALPGIKPAARQYTMGDWPQRRMKMRNGRVERWPLSGKPSGDRIELTWENITYTQAELLCYVWDSNYGKYGTLSLPPETFAGADGDLAEFLLSPIPGATWHPAGAPTVDSGEVGFCTVRITIALRGFSVYAV